MLVLPGLAVCATPGRAAELLRYDFAGAQGAPAAVAAGVEGAVATWVGQAGGFSAFHQDAFVAVGALPETYDRHRYLEITIAAAEGRVLQFETLTFLLGGSVTGAAAGEVQVAVRSDADLYATHLALTPGPGWRAGHALPGPGNPTYTMVTADLRHPLYQGRRSLTLRLHGIAAPGTTEATLRFDSITLTGTTATAGVRLHVHDVCIYGGTSGGVAGAVAARRQGKRAALLAQGLHLGGMSSGGLGATDKGSVSTIGGISREFYIRVGQKYGGGIRYDFEPHVAETVFDELVAEVGVDVFYGQRLARVTMDGSRLREITMDNGDVHRAAMFIDASYEGDLMAMAGVTYAIGREDNSVYSESFNGVRLGAGPSSTRIDPYVVPGDPSSGLIPNVQTHVPGPPGSGDALTQAYNFRLCLSQAADRHPFRPPAGYDPWQYELLARFLGELTHSISTSRFMTLTQVGNGKTDTNNRGGAISTDLPEASWAYPDADHLTRREIWLQHEDFIRGFLYFLSSDDRAPPALRAEMATWGYAADEFQDNDGWPHQLYVREARRMVSDYVMTQGNSEGARVPSDSIALASYPNDSHTVARVAVDGIVRVDGGLFVAVNPYPIAYRSIVPRVGECSNLFVTFALSASHVAFGSLRMEPVFMMTTQSAALAACLAIDEGVAVQEVDYDRLALELAAVGQVTGVGSVDPYGVENSDADLVEVEGAWSVGANVGSSGVNYVHDQNTDKGQKSFRFRPDLAQAGSYTVSLWWVANSNRASNVPVDIHHAGGTTTVIVNQRLNGGQWVNLGTYDFDAGRAGSVRLRTDGTNGFVIADAARFFPGGSPGVSVQIFARDAQATEPVGGAPAGARAGSVTVLRTGGSLAGPLAVQLATAGTAREGQDYEALPASVEIPAQARAVTVTIRPLADDLVEGDETVELRLLPAPGSYDLGARRTAVVTLADAPWPAWQARHFTPSQGADALIGAAAADPDGDGHANLWEAWTGTDPWVADAPTPLAMLTMTDFDGADYMAIELTVRTGTGLAGQLEVAAGLVAWQAGDEVVETTLLADDGVTQRWRWRDRTPVEAATQRFLRLRLAPATD